MEKLDSVLVTRVLKLKEIVILMFSAKMLLLVDQTIAQMHLVLTLKLIVVIKQLLEMKIFVHLEFLVENMKEIVIQMMSVKQTFSVILEQVVQHLLDLHLMWIAVCLDVSLIK